MEPNPISTALTACPVISHQHEATGMTVAVVDPVQLQLNIQNGCWVVHGHINLIFHPVIIRHLNNLRKTIPPAIQRNWTLHRIVGMNCSKWTRVPMTIFRIWRELIHSSSAARAETSKLVTRECHPVGQLVMGKRAWEVNSCGKSKRREKRMGRTRLKFICPTDSFVLWPKAVFRFSCPLIAPIMKMQNGSLCLQCRYTMAVAMYNRKVAQM